LWLVVKSKELVGIAEETCKGANDRLSELLENEDDGRNAKAGAVIAAVKTAWIIERRVMVDGWID
jgi:hypothetical protein